MNIQISHLCKCRLHKSPGTTTFRCETVTNCHALKMKAADRICLLPIEFRNCQKKRKTNFCKWHLQKMPLIFN